MWNNSQPKRVKKQKYPAPKKKFTPEIPIRPSILNKIIDSDAIIEKIEKWCDEAKNNKK